MVKPIRIGDRLIGPGQPCFIIAEAGSNHDGRLEQAKDLIRWAAQAKADAVKFQVFRARRLYPQSAGTSRYLRIARPIHEVIAELEMPYEWIPELAEECRKHGIEFLCSVFDREGVDLLDPYVRAFKVASYELSDIPLVRYVAGKGKPVILSTGAADLSEVEETVAEMRATGNDQLALLQCTASYPAPLATLHLRAMKCLQERFDVPVGLSDHSRDPLVGPLTAVGAGAQILEKHFTLSNDLPGPDHRFAVEPAELVLMVQKVRDAELALGQEVKAIDPVEQELRDFTRRGVFTVRAVAEGEHLTEDNIAVMRCGSLPVGLPPKRYPGLLGKVATRDLPAETPIREGDFR